MSAVQPGGLSSRDPSPLLLVVAAGTVLGLPVRVLLLIAGPTGEKERYQKIMARAAKFLKSEARRLVTASRRDAHCG